MPYCNNLKISDPVFDVVRSRKGTVAAQPRESSTNVQVEFEGNTAAIYVPIAQLRLIVDGKPEDVPPHDGELPPQAAVARGPRPSAPELGAADDVAEAIRKRHAAIKAEMEALTAQFTRLRTELDKLTAAMAALA